MPDRKRHIFLDGFNSNEDFRSRRTGRNPIVPPQDRFPHGANLVERYTDILRRFDDQRPETANPITDDTGIFIEITSAPDVKLPLGSLDC